MVRDGTRNLDPPIALIEAQTCQVLAEYQCLQNDVEQIINWGKLMIELMMRWDIEICDIMIMKILKIMKTL